MNSDEELTFKLKIARQMVTSKYPFSNKRTRGEKNEDAHYMMRSKEFENIWQLIKDRDTKVLNRLKSLSRETKDVKTGQVLQTVGLGYILQELAALKEVKK